MNQIRYIADEDLRNQIVQAVRRLEPAIDFTTVQEMGMSGFSDAELLAFANHHQIIIVSHDVNTLKGLAERRVKAGQGIAGVFLVLQRMPTRQVADSLMLIWSASTVDEWRDQIIYLPI
jgi:predicted nuclease of predicted toxin-antitoxin system